MLTLSTLTFANCLTLALIIIAFIAAIKSICVVSGTKIAVLERRWLGKNIPNGRVVALKHEVGIQARILGPGLHFLFPFIYKIKKHEMTIIEEGEIGLVKSIDGEPVPAGRIFAAARGEHNFFQDGEAFIKNNGEKGPQIEILPPGNYRINPFLFHVEKTDAINIPKNRVGVVVARDGQPIIAGSLLAHSTKNHNDYQNGEAFIKNGGQKGPQIDILLPGTYRINTKLFSITVTDAAIVPPQKVGLVNSEAGRSLTANEYVAQPIEGHQNFQNAAVFIEQGGQRGPQFDILKPGTYYINPLIFKVTLQNVLNVERGEVGVIVSNIGKDPTAEANSAAITSNNGDDVSGIERYVVPEGYRGIQRNVLGPGVYYLNTLAYTPYKIPTTNLTIDWATNNEVNANITEAPQLNPLTIVSKDGFEMTVEVKVILRILPEQAPHMLARIGTVHNLIEHVIHPLIDSSFRNQASSSEAMKFMQDRHEEQQKVEAHVRQELARYHVECVSVLICQIKLPDSLMETLTSKVVAAQQMSMYDAQQETEGRRKEMEKTKAQADLQPSLVKAEIDVQIATQQKQQNVILAEGKSQSTRLEQQGIAAGVQSVGEAEAAKIRAIGDATAEAYRQQVETLGQHSLAMIELMKQISSGNIKITPDIMVKGGDGDGGGLPGNVLTAYLSQLMSKDKQPLT